MKKLLVFIPLILLLFPMKIAAQSYDELWKQVEAAGRKDLPKTAIVSLRKIEKKAQREKAYGQLLAANFLASSIQTQISPDSMDVELNNLKAKAREAERKDEVLSAIYNCVLGWIEQGKSDGNSAEYFKKALSNPSLLARQKAANYTPLVKIGKDDHIFGGDLLHVIGMQARDFDKLNRYYVEHGNREAACYTALLAVDEKDNKNSGDKVIDWEKTCGDGTVPFFSSSMGFRLCNEDENMERFRLYSKGKHVELTSKSNHLYDDEGNSIIDNIVNILVDEDILIDGKIDVKKLQAITFDPAGGKYIALGDAVGNAYREGRKYME